MWRCDYCRARFEDRDTGINHARARHSRDYTACRQEPSDGAGPAAGPRRTRWLPSMPGIGFLPHLGFALLLGPILAALRPGSLSA